MKRLFLIFFAFAFVLGGSSAWSQTPAQPNLVVRDVQAGAGSVVFTVENTGAVATPASFRVNLDWIGADNRPVSSRFGTFVFFNQALAPGTSLTYAFPSQDGGPSVTDSGVAGFFRDTPAAATQLRISANPFSSFFETSHTDNLQTVPIPLADLQVEDIEVGPQEIAYTIVNRGAAPAAANFLQVEHVFVNVAGNTVPIQGSSGNDFRPVVLQLENISIAPGSEQRVTTQTAEALRTLVQDQTIFRRARALRITLDTRNAVGESNEQNNTAHGDVGDVPNPDLVVEDVVVTLSRLQYRIANIGDGTTEAFTAQGGTYFTVSHAWVDAAGAVIPTHEYTGSVRARMEPDASLRVDTFLDETDVDFLGLQEFLLRRPARATALRLVVDRDAHQREAREDNNTVSHELPLPNFVLENVRFSGTALLFDVRNAGTGPTVLASAVSVFLQLSWMDANNTLISNSNFIWNVAPAMSTGERKSVDTRAVQDVYSGRTLHDFIADVPNSARQLHLSIDSNNTHAESNEEDNTVRIDRLLPDLRVERVHRRSGVDVDGAILDSIGIVFQNDADGIIPANQIIEYELQWLGDNDRVLETGTTYRYTYRQSAPVLAHTSWRLRSIPRAGASGDFLGVPFDALDAVRVQELNGSYSLSVPPAVLSSFFEDRPAQARGMRVTVDPRGFIHEWREENNSTVVRFSLPDLTFGDGSVHEEDVSAGNGVLQFVARYVLVNESEERTVGSGVDVLHEWVDENGAVIGTSFTMTTAPLLGEAMRNFFSWNIDRGNLQQFVERRPQAARRMRVTVDPTDVHRESNETNNAVEYIIILPETEAEELVEVDETVEPEELDVEEPDILPDSALYPVKRLVQKARLALTVNKQKDADLRRRYLNEQIIEMQRLAEAGESERIGRQARQYERDLDELTTRAAAVSGRNAAVAQNDAFRDISVQMRHQIVLGRLSTDARQTDQAAIASARGAGARLLTDAASRLSSGDTGRAVREGLRRTGSPLRSLRDLEVVEFVRGIAGDRAPDALDAQAERIRNRFVNAITTASPIRRLAGGYVERAGGDEAVYSRIVNDLSGARVNELTSETVREMRNALQMRREPGASQASDTQERDSGEESPSFPQSSTTTEDESCTEDEFNCHEWSDCSPGEGTQIRECYLIFDCPGVTTTPPEGTRVCETTSACTDRDWNCNWDSCVWVGPGTEQGQQRLSEACYKLTDCTGDTPPSRVGETRACSARQPAPRPTPTPAPTPPTTRACTDRDWNCNWDSCVWVGPGTEQGQQRLSEACYKLTDCTGDTPPNRVGETRACSARQPEPAPTQPTQPTTPACTESDWNCHDWGNCSSAGAQTRECYLFVEGSCAGGYAPETTQSCTRAPSTNPAWKEVWIPVEGEFPRIKPSSIHIAYGGTLLFTNTDSVAHTVRFDFRSNLTLQPGETVSITVPDEGGNYYMWYEDHTEYTAIVNVY